MSENVTTDQLQDLDAHERDTVLFFLKGYLSDYPEFQEGLRRAYALVLRDRAYADPEGLRLVKEILDRKQARNG